MLELEETQGLVRPITIILFGMVLARSNARLPQGIAAGSIIRDYLYSVIHAPELREHVGKILPAMITKAATKHPRSIDEIAAQSRLDPNLVRGALLQLGNEGLVRPLDQNNNVWEISHDFV